MRLLLILLACLATTAAAQVPDSSFIRRALRIHRQVPMIDAHNDLPWEIRTRFGNSLDRADLSRDLSDSIHTDIPRLRAGGVGAQFWSLWSTTQVARTQGPTVILEQIDLVKRMERRWPDVFVPARTADDIERAHRQGKVASLMGVEGGDYMRNSIGVMRTFFELGARYMTLTWNATLPWVDAASDTLARRGLTPFGREVVREMNRLGMMVDISHVSPTTMSHVLQVTESPVIFSHSSARGLADHRRNVPDSILRLMPRNGGVVMVNFYCDFVDSARIRHNNERAAFIRNVREGAMARSQDTAVVFAEIRRATAQFDSTRPAPRPGLGIMADHIEHIRNVAGVDHVGYGSDYDGIDCAPEGLEDVSTFPRLTAELLRRGWSENDVKKVVGLNMLRVMRENERIAARLRRERPPFDGTIGQLDSGIVR